MCNNIFMDKENLELKKRILEDSENFWEVIDRYQKSLLSYILKISDVSYEDAENLLQDIFVKIYRYINEYDERYSFSGWIYRIAHNVVIDDYRKRRARPQDVSLDDDEYSNIIESIADEGSPLSELRKKDIRSCVQKAISSLPQKYREAVVLRCIAWHSYEDISDILKIPVGTASTLINRARTQLKENLIKFRCN